MEGAVSGRAAVGVNMGEMLGCFFYLKLGLLADLLARCQSERAHPFGAFSVLLLFAGLGKDIAVGRCTKTWVSAT